MRQTLQLAPLNWRRAEPEAPASSPSRVFVVALTAIVWGARFAAGAGDALLDHGLSGAATQIVAQHAAACALGASLCFGMEATLRRLPAATANASILFLLSCAAAILWKIAVAGLLAPMFGGLNAGTPFHEPSLNVAFVFFAWSAVWFAVTNAEALRETHARAAVAQERVLELEALLGEAARGAGNSHLTELWIPTRAGAARVHVSSVVCLTAERDYVRVRLAGGAEHLVRTSLRALQARLDPEMFVQIHRSAVINAQHVRSLERRPTRGARIVLSAGAALEVGRNYLSAARQLVK